jgi:hypothetical protein
MTGERCAGSGAAKKNRQRDPVKVIALAGGTDPQQVGETMVDVNKLSGASTHVQMYEPPSVRAARHDGPYLRTGLHLHCGRTSLAFVAADDATAREYIAALREAADAWERLLPPIPAGFDPAQLDAREQPVGAA